MRCLKAAVLFVLVFAATYARADYPYYVTDLGVFSPQAVNGQGVVVGTLSNSTDVLVFYSKGLVQPIAASTLDYGGVTVANFQDNGTLAFSATVYNDSDHTSQFGVPIIYSNGSFSVIPNVAGVPPTANSWGINSAGAAGGVYTNASGSGQFVFDGTTTTLTQGSNNFYAPNDLGQQIGSIRQGSTVAAIKSNGTITALTDARGNPIFLSGPSAINDNDFAIIGGSLGEINGSLFTSLPQSGLLTGRYTSLSSSNTAVGLYQVTSTTTHAIYFDGNSAVDLNSLIDPTSGWTLTSATWISDTGYIIGQGTHDGVAANFLMTPVPEPVASGLLLITGTLLFSRRRKQVFNRGAL